MTANIPTARRCVRSRLFTKRPTDFYINPDACIDCDACVPECPVEAIFSDMSLPQEYAEWIEKNAEAENYPIISAKMPALYKESCSGPPEQSGVLAGE